MDLQGGGVGSGNAKFGSLEQLVAALEGKRVLKRVLIANNGVAALKGIMSMRHWAYEMVGDENAVQFVCMATPEDIGVNVEYIKMADETVEVPGGRNSNNYANVPLIIDTAKRTGCDAVWAGWGHASENPALPDGLKEAGIMFLGPPGKAMYELGDKIASTIVAQSAGVPTIAWSGSGLSCPEKTNDVPQEIFDAACVRDADHCLEVCKQLGFPLMIKASEGGGGKGIRMVHKDEDVTNAYHAVAGEVLRSPIFVMRLAFNVRHLEVQLLADEHGECMALRSRDCSVQRRHQKIIEEGPCSKTVAGALQKMESAAVRLAKLVGYRGVGTVEYLYDKEKGTFYFLELNPRLQVEHTVTELISGVNLPACMLLVGMGIPLHRIPDIRAFCSEKRMGTSRIDFTQQFEHPPRHTIACRITAENPEDGFTPTTGRIDEINFRNSKQTWGYFSVSSHGGVHEFADSQFGHIFSTASTREDAIAGMVLALKQLTIRGEIRTNKEYLVKLLDMDAFKECNISTAWLDGKIKQGIRTEAPNTFLSVLCAATYKAVERFESNRAKYLSFLEAGHVPSSELITTSMKFALVMDQVKYEVICVKSAPSGWALTLCDTHIEVSYRRLADRGLLVTLEGGRSPVVYAEEDAACMRVTIDGRTATFTHEQDPTKLKAQMPGKLVRFLVRDGDFVEANEPFCEIEVMKMYLQLKTSVAGTITLKGQPGTAVQTGKLLASIEPNDPSSVVRADENQTGWPSVPTMCGAPAEAPLATSRLGEVHQQVRSARLGVDRAFNMIRGYTLPKDQLELAMTQLAESLTLLQSPSVALQALSMPWALEGLSEEEAAALDGSEAGVERMAHVITKLIAAFLDVETLYEGGKLQQEVVESLRAERQESGKLEEVFETEIARAGPYRYRAIAQLLKISEPVAKRVRVLIQRLSVLTEAKAAMVVFSARHMLRRLDLPIVGSRDKELREALKAAKGSAGLAALADQAQYGPEVISSCLARDTDPLLESGLELFLRRLYAGIMDMRPLTFERTEDARKQLFAKWSMTAKASHDSPLQAEMGVGADWWAEEREGTSSMILDRTEATGILGVYDNLAEVEARFPLLVMRAMPPTGNCVLEVFVREHQEHLHGVMASEFAKVLKENMRSLQTTQVLRVTFVMVHAGRTPRYYTYRKKDEFQEDTMYRHIAPSLAYMLELPKLRNYDIELYRSNPIPQVHVYIAKERPGTRRGPAPPPRLFVRTAVLPSDVATGDPEKFKQLGLFDAERVLANCVHALEIATADRSLPQSRANHVFVTFEGLTSRYADMDYVIQKLADLHGSSFYAVGVIEIEIKIRCTGLAGEAEKEAVPMRWFVRNPTTKALEVETFIEVEDSQNAGRSILVHFSPDGGRVDPEEGVSRNSPVGSTRAPDSVVVGNLGLRGGVSTPGGRLGESLRRDASWEQLSALSTGSGEGGSVRIGIESTRSWEHGSKRKFYWHNNPPLAPYPIVSSHEARRMLALAQNTIYCYDWVVLFDKAIREMWQEAVHGRTDLPGLAAAVPKDPLVAREVVYSAKEGKLVEIFRAAGENTCAMVGWLWTVRCPQHYDAESGQVKERQVYVVCNDITLQSGSFSTAEDEMFAAVSRAAVSQGVPLLYVSSNSGARIGLDSEVKKHFKVKQSDDPSKLFEYLYLDDETMKKLQGKAPVVETEAVVDPASGQTHHKLTAVIGAQWGLGVENLSGSGLIAGEMARAWEKIPTISLVSGRSVGIGAYLVRLGRRVVQTRNSPIILTGHNALNKVLGKDVYTSNNQLGGQNIMGPNGVSHWLVPDDYKAVQSVLKWLSFVPDRVGNATLSRTGLLQDPVDREVEQQVTRGTPYDPRILLNGSLNEEGVWTSGLFDRDSFQESLSDWAKSVVVGRAKLGGIPTGVIVAETRALSKFNPADPADPASSSALTQQAGMVWYPDSSRKTADHLADLQREGLPCVVIANWRGFSGGMRDMYDEVLKFGADIVQNLTSFELPVLVYIPPAGELRGGAWVVIDPKINPRHIEMFVDDGARGGVLEPEGIVEIKFRDREILATIDRLDPECSRLAAQLATAEGQLADYLKRTLSARHEQLYPVYKAVAVEFADLHDKPGRMMAVNSINGVVPWKDSRKFLHGRLRRRLLESELRTRLAADAGVKDWAEQGAVLSRWALRESQGEELETDEESTEEPASELSDEVICTAFEALLRGSSEKRLSDGLRVLGSRDALRQMQAILSRHPELKAHIC